MATDNSLSKRLERIKKLRTRGSNGRTVSGDKASLNKCTSIPGWSRRGDFLFRRDEAFDSPFFSDNGMLQTVLHPDYGEILLHDMLFYDLETTGLSSGAGVVAFLAGFGRVENGRFIVRQYFMSDFPGEREFLESVRDEIGNSAVLVSYNGRTFDRHLITSRSLMNGLSMPDTEEIDLLHTARRLWKDHVPSCSLSSIEDNVLGIKRVHDVPGRDIPDLYFSFLKSGKVSVLDGVFTHHLQDIVSLAVLFRRISDLWRNPERCTGGECYSLGKYMLLKGNPEGEKLLYGVWRKGGNLSYRAGVLLGYYYKKNGRIKEAEKVWSTMWNLSSGYIPGIELAKYYEHKCRDYRSALDITAVLEGKFPVRRKELLHRKKRLLRKLDRSIRR